jgi:drug/metabolite transporter (DMT)-like permease
VTRGEGGQSPDVEGGVPAGADGGEAGQEACAEGEKKAASGESQGAPVDGGESQAADGGKSPGAAPGKSPGKAPVYFMMVLAALFFGGTFSAGKLASEESGPLTAAFFRFLISMALLLPLLKASQGSFLPKGGSPRVWILLGLSTLTGLVLYNYFFIKGLSMTPAGRASVIVAVNPAFIFLGSVVFFGERLSLVRALGMLLAVFGSVLVVSSGDLPSLLDGRVSLGDLFMLLCVLVWAAYSLLGKLLVGEATPLAANAWTAVLSLPILLPLAIMSGEPPEAFLSFSLTTWAAIAFLGVFGTVLGFTFFYKGILILGPSRASVFICLVPFFGILCGAVVFGEEIRLFVVAGLAVSILGLLLIQRH